MTLKKQGNRVKPIRLLMMASIFAAGLFSYPLLIKNATPFPKPYSTFKAPVAVRSAFSESFDVCFTPNQSCLPIVVKSINNAKSSILLLGYSFTSKPITYALIQAKKRGVKVRIVLDHSQQFQKYSKEVIQALFKEHMDVRFDYSVKIAHNKILIIDGLQTISGSYNWVRRESRTTSCSTWLNMIEPAVPSAVS